jgi:hypothetical protein
MSFVAAREANGGHHILVISVAMRDSYVRVGWQSGSGMDASDETRLAEFVALKGEISQRSGFQQALIVLNLATVGSIVGFVVSHHATQVLLLVIALVSPTLGLLWLDHHRNIRRISAYIAGLWEPSWERHIRDCPPPPVWAMIYWGAMFLVFFAVSVATLVLAWPGDRGAAGVWVLWAVGVILTALYAGAFSALLPYRQSAARD